MSWTSQLKADPIPWLLEPQHAEIHHLVLRDLLETPADSPEVLAARRKAHTGGPIAKILNHMNPEGWWPRAGGGYNPKYRSTVWSLVYLSQLGARVEEDERIAVGCRYYLDHAFSSQGQISYNGTPSGTIDCLQGNMLAAMLELGFDDPRFEPAFEWMARTVTGEGIAPASDKTAAVRFYAYKCGPLFACGPNGRLPCAWGAAKVMLAFSRLPTARRTPQIERAIRLGVDFLLNTDPAGAAYPTHTAPKPSPNWWKFGFPVFYVTDILQIVEALVGLGYTHDPRLANALALVRSKQDDNGKWALNYDYHGKTWVDLGTPRQPSPWVTLRALRVLKAAG